jgi:hypothetical protein
MYIFPALEYCILHIPCSYVGWVLLLLQIDGNVSYIFISPFDARLYYLRDPISLLLLLLLDFLVISQRLYPNPTPQKTDQ